MNKRISNEFFYCEHLLDRKNVVFEIRENFVISQISGKGLEIYLKESAEFDEKNNQNRTYIVRDNFTEEIVGYFSLKAGLFSVEDNKSVSSGDLKFGFDTLLGIELAEFGLNSTYIDKYPENKGAGLVIFNDFIIPIVKRVQEIIGVKVLYIYALPEEKLMNNYIENYKFCRLEKIDEDNLHKRLKPRFDYGCIFMYQLI